MSNISKLPRWAQERIETLERNLKSAQQDRDEMRDGFPGSPVRVCHYGLGVDQTLPPMASIRFHVGPNDEWIECRHERDYVYVSAGAGIRVQPLASNTLTLHATDRFGR